VYDLLLPEGSQFSTGALQVLPRDRERERERERGTSPGRQSGLLTPYRLGVLTSHCKSVTNGLKNNHSLGGKSTCVESYTYKNKHCL